jgi:hypothetical protein
LPCLLHTTKLSNCGFFKNWDDPFIAKYRMILSWIFSRQ